MAKIELFHNHLPAGIDPANLDDNRIYTRLDRSVQVPNISGEYQILTDTLSLNLGEVENNRLEISGDMVYGTHKLNLATHVSKYGIKRSVGIKTIDYQTGENRTITRIIRVCL